MDILRFKTIDEARAYFIADVLPTIAEKYDTVEDMFQDWLDGTEMIIEDLEDTKRSDEYDYQTHNKA